MPNRLRLKARLLLAVLITVSVAQSTVPLSNERVRRLGDQLHCKCGCNASITGCNMINCHFSDPVRLKLLEMVDAGKSDQEILDAMVAEHGKDILQRPPAEGFYLLSYVIPYVGLAGGIGLVYLILRAYLRKRETPATATAPADLGKYKDQIERDLSDLE